MKKTNLTKDLFKFIIPSIIGLLMSALYIVVDGIFVGQGVGANALASVNIAIPFSSLLFAISSMLAVGGSALVSIKLGENKKIEAIKIFNQSISLLLVITMSFSIIGVLFPNKLALLLGANSVLIEGTSEYLKYYSMFTIFFSLGLALSSFVRNDNNPNLAMIALISGGITNIILDYIFIFPLEMGLKGAAIASGLGQLVSVLLLMIHFIKGKGVLKFKISKIEFTLAKSIIKTGTPEFLTQISTGITTLAFNLVILERLGEIGVSSYSIISYLVTIFIAIFMGVSQGAQPLISYNYGCKNYRNVKSLFVLTIIINILISLSIYILMFIFGKNIISIFNNNIDLIHLTFFNSKIYFVSFIFAAFNIIVVCYYQSINNPLKSSIISTLRGIILIITYLLILPNLLGNVGIWISIIAAEFTTFCIAILIIRKDSSISV